MKTVAITGGTRGIGLGLAREFLKLGCNVAICGRDPGSVNTAVKCCADQGDSSRIFGTVCDVTMYSDVVKFWDLSERALGHLDIWINNAGVSHHQKPLYALEAKEIKDVVSTNMTGALNGASVAVSRMVARGSGAFYNMEGLGSDGRIVAGVALYGCTKYGLAYITNALVRETKTSPVIIGAIRPGMVVTELLTRDRKENPEAWEKSKAIFNILADKVETITPWIARKVLDNKRKGVRIQWLTPGKAFFRFLTASFIKRNVTG